MDTIVPPIEIDGEAIEKLLGSKSGQATMRATWQHNKSVSSAYWDPRGRSIVSTSYDDTIRCKSYGIRGHFECIESMSLVWDYRPSVFVKEEPFPSARPFSQIKHNCQTVNFAPIHNCVVIF